MLRSRPSPLKQLPFARPLVVRLPVARRQRSRPSYSTAANAHRDRPEAFEAASQRLTSLLTDASLGNKDTVPMDHFDTMSAEERLTVCTNLGSLTMLVSIAVCWLFGEDDPLGGIWLDDATLSAALAGLAYAAPLVLCSFVGRSRLTKELFPVLDQLHDSQQKLARHFIAGMNLPQVGILLAFMVLPALMLLLPATTAGITWSFSFISQVLLQPWGDVVRLSRHAVAGPLLQVLPPVLAGYLGGAFVACCFSPRPKELQLVRDAVITADKFFAVTGGAGVMPLVASPQPPHRRPTAVLPPGGPASVFAATASAALDEGTSPPGQQEDEPRDQPGACSGNSSSGQAAADAFRTVAMVWLLSQRHVARLAFVLTALDVSYLAVVWQATDNLATPAVAAFLWAACECLLGEQQAAQRGAQEAAMPVLADAQDKRR